jgi:hypothetical protein
MHNQQGVDSYLTAIEEAKAQGGKIECGGKVFINTDLCSTSYILIGTGKKGEFIFKQNSILKHVVSVAFAGTILL